MMARFLGVIPARGGSKTIARKNIKDFSGKPLLAWTLEAARESGIFERFIVSTEDPEIADIAKAYGAEVPLLRPVELASDTTLTAPVIRHALDWFKECERWIPDYVIVLEPTSPLRQPRHIREAAALLDQGSADSVASVSVMPHHYVPQKALQLQADGSLAGLDNTHPRDMVHRRQDLGTYYAFNGLIFGCKTKCVLEDPPTLWGNKVIPYRVDSQYNVDLDRPDDWAPAEIRLQHLLKQETT